MAAGIALGVGALLVGGVTSLIGSYWEGEISEAQFDREMAFREKQLAQQIKSEARRLGIQESQLRQNWKTFVAQLKENRRQFGERIGLEKESLAHKKFMDLIQPTIERNRRSRNLLRAFSEIKKAPSPAGVSPLRAAPPQAPQAPANPLTQGV